ncbi:MAG TPA: Ni/Fe-hydrogenase, b-type cytochrome subunit [Bryobacteraceae bacterium]|jgi:Ni/Fe-hydrogenase 1 B-type cytochrome subunit|nr:Ni/Fe-hydrogenase, b-type cytochrome subunit [Bryobacteraceae bacterium]
MRIELAHPASFGPVAPVYVWQYPLRLVHWGLVISIGVLSLTGYYIHDPFIVGQAHRPFLMGWFRFAHEAFGMLFLALFLLRVYLFFGGNKWEGWRQFIPLSKDRFREMWEVAKFYLFIRPTPVSRIGHNQLAAFSYVGIYSLMLVEVLTGLVMYQRLSHNAFLLVVVGWIPSLIGIQYLRLIHFFLMFVFIAFAILHVHLSMLVSRAEKRGLMDSIFIGYKIIPVDEIEEEFQKDRRGP